MTSVLLMMLLATVSMAKDTQPQNKTIGTAALTRGSIKYQWDINTLYSNETMETLQEIIIALTKSITNNPPTQSLTKLEYIFLLFNQIAEFIDEEDRATLREGVANMQAIMDHHTRSKRSIATLLNIPDMKDLEKFDDNMIKFSKESKTLHAGLISQTNFLKTAVISTTHSIKELKTQQIKLNVLKTQFNTQKILDHAIYTLKIFANVASEIKATNHQLINQDTLTNTLPLQEIANMVKLFKNLTNPVDWTNLTELTDVIGITIKATDIKFLFDVYIALVAKQDVFTLMEVYKKPLIVAQELYFPVSDKFLALNEEEFFSLNSMEECTQHRDMHICQPTMLVYNRKTTTSCTLELATSSSTSKIRQCNYEKMPTNNGIFTEKVDNLWKLYILRPMQISVKCASNEEIHENITESSHGRTYPGHCSIRTANWSLRSYTSYESAHTFKSQLIIPTHATPDDINMNIPTSTWDDIIKHLTHAMDQMHKFNEVEVQPANIIHKTDFTNYPQMYAIIGLISTVILIVALTAWRRCIECCTLCDVEKQTASTK